MPEDAQKLLDQLTVKVNLLKAQALSDRASLYAYDVKRIHADCIDRIACISAVLAK